MTLAARITESLAGLGRHVPEDVVAHDLDGLEGLTDAQQRSVELASFGVTDDGPATNSFVPDHGPVEAVVAIERQGAGALVMVLVASLLAVVPSIAVPLIIRLFVDRYLVAGDSQWATVVVVALIGAALTVAVLTAVTLAALRLLTMRLSKTGQVWFTWHVLGMRIPTLTRFGAGVLVALSGARQRMSFQAGTALPLAAVSVVNAVAFAVALLVLDLVMGLVGIGIGLLTVLGSVLVLRHRRPIQARADDDLTELSGVTAQAVNSIESIKAAAWEQFAFTRWAQVRARAAASLTSLGVANQWLAILPTISVALGLGLVLVVGALRVIGGTLSLGTLVAAQSFVVAMLAAVGGVVALGGLVQTVVSAERQSKRVLSEPLAVDMVDVPAPVAVAGRLRGAVMLKAVTFGYDVAGPPLVRDLSLTIASGSRVALVGPSGSGKTTIARLIIGELQPWSGCVELDGISRLLLTRDVRTRDVAYVPQEAVLFPGTVRDNLTMWDDTVSDDALRQAMSDACIDDAILARPGGLYAEVAQQDSGFSGGELQRISIARALVRDPRVLVLDEATSALDPVIEAEVESRLRRRGCTALVVAHRLSTIRDADEILVIHDGRIAQRGTYDDIKTVGAFAELLNG